MAINFVMTIKEYKLMGIKTSQNEKLMDNYFF